jgi:hypothetical protein
MLSYKLDKNQKQEEIHTTANMKYVASMMPSALEMHKFMNFMKKDPLFEDRTAYKIVTGIQTQRDKERLEFIINTKEISKGVVSEIF